MKPLLHRKDRWLTGRRLGEKKPARRIIEADGWQLAAGSWQLAAGSWQLAAGGWRLAARFKHP